MHPSALAYLASQRQTELLQEAETRRLRTGSARRHAKSDGRGGFVRGPSAWGQNLMTRFRPAPEPCCA